MSTDRTTGLKILQLFAAAGMPEFAKRFGLYLPDPFPGHSKHLPTSSSVRGRPSSKPNLKRRTFCSLGVRDSNTAQLLPKHGETSCFGWSRRVLSSIKSPRWLSSSPNRSLQ